MDGSMQGMEEWGDLVALVSPEDALLPVWLCVCLLISQSLQQDSSVGHPHLCHAFSGKCLQH